MEADWEFVEWGFECVVVGVWYFFSAEIILCVHDVVGWGGVGVEVAGEGDGEFVAWFESWGGSCWAAGGGCGDSILFEVFDAFLCDAECPCVGGAVEVAWYVEVGGVVADEDGSGVFDELFEWDSCDGYVLAFSFDGVGCGFLPLSIDFTESVVVDVGVFDGDTGTGVDGDAVAWGAVFAWCHEVWVREGEGDLDGEVCVGWFADGVGADES